jgi:hypothetical protein
MSELDHEQRIARRRREDDALDKVEEARQQVGERLGRALRRSIKWLWIGYTVLVLGLASAYMIGYLRLQDTIHDRCEAGNELRRNVRDLAVDLGADTHTRAVVDKRFKDVGCP